VIILSGGAESTFKIIVKLFYNNQSDNVAMVDKWSMFFFYIFVKKFNLRFCGGFKPGVNFINILSARFLYKSKLSSLSLVMFGCVIFWLQNIGAKCMWKMSMILTPGKQAVRYKVFVPTNTLN